MNDEIKEILDKLKDDDWYDELDLTGDKWIELKQTETKQLLDYITNLQQNYDNNINKYEELIEKYSILQQENERLQTQLNIYENPDDLTLFYMWLDEKAKDKMKKLQQENERLKENAIEGNCKKWLLNILKGDSDE